MSLVDPSWPKAVASFHGGGPREPARGCGRCCGGSLGLAALVVLGVASGAANVFPLLARKYFATRGSMEAAALAWLASGRQGNVSAPVATQLEAAAIDVADQTEAAWLGSACMATALMLGFGHFAATWRSLGPSLRKQAGILLGFGLALAAQLGTVFTGTSLGRMSRSAGCSEPFFSMTVMSVLHLSLVTYGLLMWTALPDEPGSGDDTRRFSRRDILATAGASGALLCHLFAVVLGHTNSSHPNARGLFVLVLSLWAGFILVLFGCALERLWLAQRAADAQQSQPTRSEDITGRRGEAPGLGQQLAKATSAALLRVFGCGPGQPLARRRPAAGSCHDCVERCSARLRPCSQYNKGNSFGARFSMAAFVVSAVIVMVVLPTDGPSGMGQGADCPAWASVASGGFVERNQPLPPPGSVWPTGLDPLNPSHRAMVIAAFKATALLSFSTAIALCFVIGALIWDTHAHLGRRRKALADRAETTMRRAIAYVSHEARGPLHVADFALSMLERDLRPEPGSLGDRLRGSPGRTTASAVSPGGSAAGSPVRSGPGRPRDPWNVGAEQDEEEDVGGTTLASSGPWGSVEALHGHAGADPGSEAELDAEFDALLKAASLPAAGRGAEGGPGADGPGATQPTSQLMGPSSAAAKPRMASVLSQPFGGSGPSAGNLVAVNGRSSPAAPGRIGGRAAASAARDYSLSTSSSVLDVDRDASQSVSKQSSAHQGLRLLDDLLRWEQAAWSSAMATSAHWNLRIDEDDEDEEKEEGFVARHSPADGSA
ncbi:hypothetical protein FNF29_02478 [Cafeteria roenbergensis]|uniref:Uncharacterized protein n=1 Tax=Cafeteria roenbergensis TaxID=33653 RepID=A0A5A8CNE4_CAFRO|nr:hypothetical protein FNF29_02478 [Cafeteria roenbergensis]|eukprot:KAA0154258.1 hypothetical protein FNF29_02478 [Cafeteria roenbergensis]